MTCPTHVSQALLPPSTEILCSPVTMCCRRRGPSVTPPSKAIEAPVLWGLGSGECARLCFTAAAAHRSHRNLPIRNHTQTHIHIHTSTSQAKFSSRYRGHRTARAHQGGSRTGAEIVCGGAIGGALNAGSSRFASFRWSQLAQALRLRGRGLWQALLAVGRPREAQADAHRRKAECLRQARLQRALRMSKFCARQAICVRLPRLQQVLRGTVEPR